ncbi:hypothetical protein BDBG_00579 [Blastomyces gilchristii SLH14081]|uniref:Uncharacterized protein n=1 Tax=Blastomyces gilchristii (strain SLH14081) TaxID=559298 RepID=A0A179UBL5_BLAGS|nr:uncharacterized protein BDBG_00579 [Blastomyces gilchristii SLH14081]OAT03922.1 hypothetical protein BDBG_00579 [Blastomyces gilchristii SLH14081]
MANAVTLAAFLQNGPPHVRINAPPNPGPNTTNTAYSWEDIHSLNAWPEFTLQHIMNRYHQLLDNTSLPSESITSLGLIIRNQHQGLQGLMRVSYDEGEGARIMDNYKPDAAFFDEMIPATTSWNRAPGEVKSSWKWTSNLRNSLLPAGCRECRQVLSQLNFYMKQHHARYGYIITDLELVPVRRRDDVGNLDLAQPIPWNARGNPGNEQLTVMLALWYLGMLAA